ncbi:glycosyltransferase family 39 protein [Candidatus Gottesmanbacteria bacterium]|nr:glycosyltransferase family 39 protein [Candidatus Gottesmanbacteria bacterium]
MDLLFTFLIPAVYTFGYYFIIAKLNFFRNLSSVERLVISPLIGLIFIILLPTIWGLIMPSGLKFLQQFIFVIGLFGLSMNILFIKQKEIIGKIPSIIKNIKFWHLKKNFNKNLYFSATLLLLIILLFRLVLLNFLRPISDPDVLESYLPFARTIYFNDHIPLYNFYNNSPMTIPPIGGPIFFGFFYGVTNSITSEAFKFAMLPYFLASIVIFFLLFKKLLDRNIALFACLIFVSLPLVEDFFFEAALYPDFIFLYLFAISTYFTIKIISDKQKKLSLDNLCIFGFSLSLLFLIKYQGIFLWIVLLPIVFLKFFPQKFKVLAGLPIIVPFFISKIFPFQSQQPYIMYSAIFIILLHWILIHKQNQIASQSERFSIFSFLLLLLILSAGFIFVLRNYLIFGGLNDTRLEIESMRVLTRSLGIIPNTRSMHISYLFTIFLAQDLGVYYLLFKIIGFIEAVKKRLWIFIYIIDVYFIYWFIFLGAEASRWLLPVLPFLSLFIVIGAQKIINKRLLIYTLWGSLIFTIFSSRFFFWTLAILIYGMNKVRSFSTGGLNNLSITTEKLAYINLLNYVNQIFREVNKLLFVITSRSEVYNENIITLLFYGIGGSLLLIMIGRFLRTRYLLPILSVSLIVPYLFIFFAIGKGNPLSFATYERQDIFNYWGLTTFVVPLMSKKNYSQGKILVFGLAPGLSYYTNRQVYNLNYGYGLDLFSPIFNETDISKIYNFFQQNNFDYFILLENTDTSGQFTKLKIKTHIFDILDNPIYFRLILDTDKENNLWKVYQLKKVSPEML